MRRGQTGAELLIALLKQAGVQLVFGLPGDTSVALYDALSRHHPSLRHIVTRDERHAAYMADGAARVTGRRMVVEASSGGGAAYLASGLVEAYAASVPVLAVVSDIHQDSRGSGALTEFPVDTLLAGTAKAVYRVAQVHQLPRFFRALWEQLGTQRPAPGALVIPENLWEASVPEGCEAAACAWKPDLPTRRPEADPSLVEQAARWLATAQQPVIVAGGGVHWSNAYTVLQALAETYQLPIATTIHGKGALSERHPLYLGVVGANGGQPATNAYVAQADVVLLVGTRANATDTLSFRAPSRQGTRIIQIDIDPLRAGANYPGAIPLVGDARVVLEQLIDALSQTGSIPKAERMAQITQVRKQGILTGAGPEFSVRRIVQLIHRLAAAHAEVIVVGDPGTPTPYLAAYWTLNRPGRTVILPRGVGPMGYAIPAGIGIALACPQRPVLVFTTEGSMAMAAGELETAVRYNLPVLFVQLTNHAYGWIQTLQHLYYGKRYFGVRLGPVDSVQLARSMGVEAARVTDPDQLVRKVTQFFQQGRPWLLEVPVRSMIEEMPPVQPWLEAQQGERERPVY
ncbi:MAG: thiamine pyrophosphate-binding protein [Rhodothermus sp.]|nr:thiamine pyrophosphate-binding protein [Rhodothermus sp.]